ncbi:MAG: MaoC family dehydratase [Acidimicrobiia bacterium]|nr:MAG: MaoC family dehydratase [Acidimicrobiia bacterium]
MMIVPVDQLSSYVGTEIGRSDWFTIDQGRIDAFAEATLDNQWIHVEGEAAATGPFGKPIAHGFLTLSMLSHLTGNATIVPEGATMLINYGSDKVRFLAPVRVGSNIRAIATLKEVKEKSPGQHLMTSNIVVEIEGEDTPALVADILTLAVMAPTS